MPRRIIAFDMDGVLCSRDTEEGGVLKYEACVPHPDMIEIVNECYDAGHEIVIYTARGMAQFKGRVSDTYDNLYEITKGQLRKWGVKHHRLVMGKIQYDLLIDDHAVHDSEVKSHADLEWILNG